MIDAWKQLKEVHKCAKDTIDAGTDFDFSAKDVNACHKDAVTANKIVIRLIAQQVVAAVPEDTEAEDVPLNEVRAA